MRPRAAYRGIAAFALGTMVSTVGAVSNAQGQTELRAETVDTVRIDLAGDEAVVQQVIPHALGVIEAYAMRVPGQTLTILDVLGDRGPLEHTLVEAEGTTRIAVASLSDVLVRYRVAGPLERVPLFVRGGGAVVTVAHEVAEPYLIRVTANDDRLEGVDTDTSMPRFGRSEDGVLEVRLSSVPSFVRISSGGPFSFARLADVMALLLILCGSLFAFKRLRT